MRKLILIFSALALICFHPFAQSVGVQNGQVTIGAIDSLYSEILGEQRQIWVSVPESANNTQQNYPVLYVLDGNAHFYSVVGMLRQLSASNGNMILPEMIVVGIPNTDRTRDLTPSHFRFLATSGGAENFTSFIEKELIPYIDSKYPTTSYRTLVGHSWGGLFVLNTLTKHSELFENYLAIDPTIRWNNLSFFKEASEVLKAKNFEGKSLFLGVANRLPKGLDLTTVKADSTPASEHIRTILKLTELAKNAQGINFTWKFYPEDNHNGVPLIATYDGFRFLFEWFNFNEEFIFEEGATLSAPELIEFIENHFGNISKHFGYTFLPPQNLINRFANIAASEGQTKKVEALYELNIRNYPKSSLTHEALGDFYRTNGNNKKAIELYEQSLQIEANDRVRQKLERLKG